MKLAAHWDHQSPSQASSTGLHPQPGLGWAGLGWAELGAAAAAPLQVLRVLPYSAAQLSSYELLKRCAPALAAGH
jgi:hypothetical protein